MTEFSLPCSLNAQRGRHASELDTEILWALLNTLIDRPFPLKAGNFFTYRVFLLTS